MNLSRLMHESTQYPNAKCYIRYNNCKIDQFFNQSSIPFWIIKDGTAIKSQIHMASIGILAGLYPKNHVSRRFRAYFH